MPCLIAWNEKRLSFQYSFPFVLYNLHCHSEVSLSQFNCWFQLEKPTEVIASRSRFPLPCLHSHHSFKWLLTVIERNCNNMDLISTGNKQCWSKQHKASKRDEKLISTLLGVGYVFNKTKYVSSSHINRRELQLKTWFIFSSSLFTHFFGWGFFIPEKNLVCLLYAKEFKIFFSLRMLNNNNE